MSNHNTTQHPQHLTTLPSYPKPARTPSPDARTTSRVSKLIATLADIKHSIDIRTYFVLQNYHGHYFCPHCSPTDLLGSCGPTCPLLRPYHKSSTQPYALTPEWMQCAHLDAQLYKSLVDDVARHGDAVDAERLRQWEKAAEKLRRKGRNMAEQHAENGWVGVGRMTAREAGFRVGWRWEREWGGRKRVGGDGEGVPPHVRVGRRAQKKVMRG